VLPLRWKLLLTIGGPLLVIYCIVLAMQFYAARTGIREAVQRQYTDALRLRVLEMEGEMKAIAQAVQTTAKTLAMEASTANLEASTRSLLFAHPAVSHAQIVRTVAGQRSAMSVERTGADTSEVDQTSTDEINAEAGWSSPVRKGGPVYVRYAWTYEKDAQQAVSITLRVPTKFFDEKLMAEGFSQSRYPVLMARDGTYISHFEKGVVESGQSIFQRAIDVKRPQLVEVGNRVLSGNTGTVPMRGVITDEDVWVIYCPMPLTKWSLLIAIPDEQMMAPVYEQLSKLVAVMGTGLIAILGIVWFVSRRITRPVETLVHEVQSLKPGEVIAADLKCGPREIRQLSKSFKDMSVNLRQSLDRTQDEIRQREAVQSELMVARRIQESLLPPPLEKKILEQFGLDMFASNKAAREVAGDFFDHFVDERGRLVLTVADVCGKGAAAAMLMAVTRTALRGCAGACDSPGDMLRTVNRVLFEPTRDRPMFVTMIVMVLTPGSGQIVCANGGHPPPLMIGEGNVARRVAMPSAPIVGIMSDEDFWAEADAVIDWSPGDRLGIYTDGITEARQRDSKGNMELFGEERLVSLIESQQGRSVKECGSAVLSTTSEFEAGNRSDDATLMVLGNVSSVPALLNEAIHV
jgi:serine phosphatase RsbU (regulator of sigma subunit)